MVCTSISACLTGAAATLFAVEDGEETRCLHHAMGGLLATMHDAMAVFSVNANSFRRFEEGAFAPTAATWGRDNRNTALRVPDSDAAGTRIEHRVAGADAEPHLVIAAVLAGALHGIDNGIDPGEPVVGKAVPDDAAETAGIVGRCPWRLRTVRLHRRASSASAFARRSPHRSARRSGSSRPSSRPSSTRPTCATSRIAGQTGLDLGRGVQGGPCRSGGGKRR